MQIARKARVADLRVLWLREEQFSEWLTGEDGRAMLAQDLGLRAEGLRTESCPGVFPCDIAGYLVGDESHAVVIENQFGKSDHDHLGKLITHISMHSAMTAVWIVELAREDHRRAVDWLNDNTPESVGFYLAELVAHRIGDSPAAPELQVVCRPNVLSKPVVEKDPARNAEVAEEKLFRIEFWEDVFDYLRRKEHPLAAGLGRANSVKGPTFDLGVCRLSLGSPFAERRVLCYFWIPQCGSELRDTLLKMRSDVEIELLGDSDDHIEWNPRGWTWPGLRVWRAFDVREDADREAAKEWLYSHSLALHGLASRFQELAPLGNDRPVPDGEAQD